MSTKEIPCRNCITFAICKNKMQHYYDKATNDIQVIEFCSSLNSPKEINCYDHRSLLNHCITDLAWECCIIESLLFYPDKQSINILHANKKAMEEMIDFYYDYMEKSCV